MNNLHNCLIDTIYFTVSCIVSFILLCLPLPFFTDTYLVLTHSIIQQTFQIYISQITHLNGSKRLPLSQHKTPFCLLLFAKKIKIKCLVCCFFIFHRRLNDFFSHNKCEDDKKKLFLNKYLGPTDFARDPFVC